MVPTFVNGVRMKTISGKIQNICVFCGTGVGKDPAMLAGATQLGEDLARAKIGLVYGGGDLGMMGEVARSAIAGGGKVTAIIPQFLEQYVRPVEGITDYIVTETMHERKQKMFDLSDGFVALPGGVGTAEEVIEQITWGQLKQHHKPIILANIHGYWQHLLDQIGHMRNEGFIHPDFELNFQAVDEAAQILPTIVNILSEHPDYLNENIHLDDL